MADDSNTTLNDAACPIRKALHSRILHRSASLTDAEKSFLSALLIDDPPTVEEENIHKKKMESATNILSDEILFSVPVKEVAIEEGADDYIDRIKKVHRDGQEGNTSSGHLPPRAKRSNPQLELWKAHRDGVAPSFLKGKSFDRVSDDIKEGSQHGRRKSKTLENVDNSKPSMDDKGSGKDDCDVRSSDSIVRRRNDDSSASSWGSSQGGFDHYDTWEVIRDEYAEDFGFKVAIDDENQSLSCNEDDMDRGIFKIIGTSADDVRAIPHVLSPPLMDSLLNFIPEHLSHGNFWLKFSLIRDGASLNILKKYCRAATHTVLAIETTNGEVFGSFTSSPWRLNNVYFGTGESFLWRMRHNRNTPVHSLFEQAQLESEIDIFPYNGSNNYIQLCTKDKLALGGGSVLRPGAEDASAMEDSTAGTAAVYLEWNDYGFGLALDENLLHGTTSPCATFGNSNLVSSSGSGEIFDVINLEIWTLTSAQTEREAEHLEMSTFFVRESIHSMSRLSDERASRGTSSSSLFSAEDFDQDKFYRRVGEMDDNETDRSAWQYANMMNPTAGSPYRMMKDI